MITCTQQPVPINCDGSFRDSTKAKSAITRSAIPIALREWPRKLLQESSVCVDLQTIPSPHTLSSAGCAQTCNIAQTPSNVACSCSWRRASGRGCPCRGVERRGRGGAVAGAAGGCIKEPERLSFAVLRSVVERRLRAGERVRSVAAGEGQDPSRLVVWAQ